MTGATSTVPGPPGMQGELFRRPAHRATPPFTVVDATGRHSDRITHLTIATAHAYRAALATGEAWLVAADGSACHMPGPAGPAVPLAGGITGGWPDAVTRILTRIQPKE